MDPEARAIIDRLGLVPLLPEGGHVRESYRDAQATIAYYLMARPDFSSLHRLEHLEVWAFHAGSPVSMLLIDASGVVSEPVLGPDVVAGQVPHVVVEPGVWQGAEPMGPWSLVTVTVTPPYADDIVAFGRREDFEGRVPGRDARVRRLCRS